MVGGMAVTPRQLRGSLERWVRFLGVTPDADADAEADRQLARVRLLRAMKGGVGFLLAAGLAALVKVL